MTRSIKASSSYLVDMYESHGLTLAKQGKSRTEFSTVILSQLWTLPKQLRSSSLAKTKKLYLGFPEWYEHNFDVFFKLIALHINQPVQLQPSAENVLNLCFSIVSQHLLVSKQ